MQNRPFDMLNEALNKEVLVILKGDKQIRGTLKAFDVHMNIVLENAQELVNNEARVRYSKLIVRGDNIFSVSM